MMKEKQKEKKDRNGYLKQPIWCFGMGLIVFGSIGDFAALGFAAQSLITAVGGFTMVANLMFARFWLGEVITKLDYFATGCIVAGITLSAAFADKSKQCYTLDDLLCLYVREEFIVYAVVLGALIVGTFVGIRHIRSVKRKYGMGSPEYLRFVCSC